MHLSVWRDGANLYAGGSGPYGMAEEGAAFAAGILSALRPLCAVGAPTPASYLRLVPSHWAGAFACWGLETREAALRFITGVRGTEQDAANFEVKCFDLAANPYLVVGALTAAGLHGIREGQALPQPITGDPARYSDDEQAELDIRRLPTTLDEAVTELAGCYFLREQMGKTLADAVLAVRRAEAERFHGASAAEVVAALRWVF